MTSGKTLYAAMKHGFNHCRRSSGLVTSRP